MILSTCRWIFLYIPSMDVSSFIHISKQISTILPEFDDNGILWNWFSIALSATAISALLIGGRGAMLIFTIFVFHMTENIFNKDSFKSKMTSDYCIRLSTRCPFLVFGWSPQQPQSKSKQEGLTVIIMNGKRQKQFPRLVASKASFLADAADEPRTTVLGWNNGSTMDLSYRVHIGAYSRIIRFSKF